MNHENKLMLLYITMHACINNKDKIKERETDRQTIEKEEDDKTVQKDADDKDVQREADKGSDKDGASFQSILQAEF